jgi:medium-chain acyl-[acyl-carrier-protein] hydrolase
MGAGIAFEVTRWLRDRGEPLPDVLIVSAARAPRFRIGYEPPPEPTDEVLLEQVYVPAEVRENAAALSVLMPALRADTRLYRKWEYRPTSPLPLPVCAVGGTDDPNVRLEHLIEWRHETTAGFAYRQFAGGHFYFTEEAIRWIQEAAVSPPVS